MLKSACALLLVSTIALSVAGAQQPSTKEPLKPDYSKEAFVYEQIASKANYEADGTGGRDSVIRVKIQSEAGVQQFGVLRFSYQSANENLDIPYVRVHKADGSTVETPAENIQDMAADVSREAPFYSDIREKHVAVRGLSAGDTLEYHYVSHLTKPLAPGQFWHAWNFTRQNIVLQEQFELTVPKDNAFKYKSPSLAPAVADQGKYRVYTWTTSNLKVDPKDKDDEQAAVQRARGRLPAPDVVFSSFQSWDEVGKWYGGLQQDRVKPSPEILAKAAELTKGFTDDDAKMRAIYKYVSTKFRYIGIAFGIGRYQPHSAADVLANQYGDCKDKHTLLASLLTAAGIKAYPALISASNEPDPDLPSPGQFNHVITVVPRGDRLIWLDSTTEVAPFEYLVPPLRDKKALVIADNKPAALVATLAELPFPDLVTVKIDGKIDDVDIFTAHFDYTVRGDEEVIFRAVFRRVPQTQWKDVVQNVSYALGFGGTVSDVAADTPENVDVPYHFSYNYTRKDFGGDWASHRITVPVPQILMPSRKNEDEKPTIPVWLGPLKRIEYESRVELPPGYAPEVPRNVTIKRDFADYHSSFGIHSRALVAKITLVTKMSQVPTEQYDNYKSLKKAIEDDRNQYLQLSTSNEAWAKASAKTIDNEVSDLPDSDNREAQEAEEETDCSPHACVDLLKQAVADDPKFVRAWVSLGRYYAFLRQPDEAIDAYRHAVALAPRERVIYTLLGFELMAEHRYDEAVGNWNALIAFAPDDKNGPANLGNCLMRLKRYPEAASAYETAIKQDPKSASLAASLGRAYLATGDDDKAVAAFQKALDLNPGEEGENHIAYELAEANKKLPEALAFAQKAVQTVEDASSKVTLSSLKVDDLGRIMSLSADWDTLGWVYFKMGNLDQAANYLNAAWTLSQDRVEANHLAQVYEKQNQKESAIRMYRFALASPAFPGAPEDTEAIQSRLNHLTASSRPVNPPHSDAAELSMMRSTKLPRVVPGKANAEFFLLIAPGPKIEDVKFISGDESLKSATKALSAMNLKAPFPEGSSARLVRRGIVACYPETGCSFVVYPPNVVGKVD